MDKLTVQEIKNRFDKEVERFSNLETGQVATVDATISLELLTETANVLVPQAENLLDIGCGAGNYTLKMLSENPRLHCTLVDLSREMLNKALERVSVQTEKVTAVQGDIREVVLPLNRFDIILAGAVLHHLRDDADWEHTFKKLYQLLKPGGCLMISDLVTAENDLLTDYFRGKWGNYLEGIGGKEYRQKVLYDTDREDTPRPVTYQLNLMKTVGFKSVEILHKNICFAAFGGIK